MPFPYAGAATIFFEDFLPQRVFVGLLVAVMVPLILFLAVLTVAAIRDTFNSLFRRRSIRKAVAPLGGELVSVFPGAEACELTFDYESVNSARIEGKWGGGRIRTVVRMGPSRYLFDFEWFDSRGAPSSVHTVAAFKASDALPIFCLRPAKGFADKLGTFVGKAMLLSSLLHLIIARFVLTGGLRPCEVRFESSPDFASCFRVTTLAALETEVRELFPPAMLEFLVRLDKRPQWYVDAACEWLFIRSAGRAFRGRGPLRPRFLVTPKRLQDFLEQASAIAQQLEQHGRFLSPATEIQSEAKDS